MKDRNAESYIREQTALYRHYAIAEVCFSLEQAGIPISEDQAVSLVQKIRDEQGMGPIAPYNMPGYREE